MATREAPPSGVRQYLPILDWLHVYQPAWLWFDLVAALTVWALIVPHAIARPSRLADEIRPAGVQQWVASVRGPVREMFAGPASIPPLEVRGCF